jgi:inorganic pyrophosphatase
VSAGLLPKMELIGRELKRRSKFVPVVIETPRGSRNKFAYDDRLRIFRLKSVLPVGTSFPYDFGFVPQTRADDGDPLDVLVLMDEPTFSGCLVRSRLIGVIQAEQSEKGSKFRNDRLIAVAQDAHQFREVRTLRALDQKLLNEVTHFFISYNETRNKTFKVIDIKGPKTARNLIQSAMKS